MLRAFLTILLFGCSQLFAQSGGAPCPIQRAAAAGQHVWLLCDGGTLYVSSDGGKTWQSRPLQTETKIRAIAILDARRGFAAGDSGLLLATENGGDSWRTVELPVRENLTAICFAGENGWLAGWSGVVLHSRDGGKTWERQETGVRQSMDSIFFLDAAHGWAAGWVGTIIRTTDGGRTWEKAQTPPSAWSLESVCFRDPENGWAVGFGGQILRSRDGGRTWKSEQAPLQSTLKWVAFDRSGRGWIAADSGVLVSDDEGESWKALPAEGIVFFRQIVPVGDSVWAVGQFGIYRQAGNELKLSPLRTLPDWELRKAG